MTDIFQVDVQNVFDPPPATLFLLPLKENIGSGTGMGYEVS